MTIRYAAPHCDRREVVDDLQTKNVTVIPYTNRSWTNRFHGTPNEVRPPLVFDYARRHYRSSPPSTTT